MLRQRYSINCLSTGESEIKEKDLKKINEMKRNGPVVELKKEEIFIRKMIILGEEPTTKMSVHFPETLEEINKLLPGTPMMEGHVLNQIPWGRIYDSEILKNVEGYKGNVIKISYYFLKFGNGIERSKRIDAGIENEGSITYRFKSAHCTICNQELMIGNFMGMEMRQMKCNHKLGRRYGGKVCYWYPENVVPLEVSHVFAGSYQKTKAILSLSEIPKTNQELIAAYGGDSENEIEIGLTDAIIATMREEIITPDKNIWEEYRKTFQKPIKPIKKEKENNEYYDIDEFEKFEGKYDIEPKYNGVFARLEKYKGNASLFTEENNELTEKFPTIISEANSLDADNFIIHCEIVKYKGKIRGTFADVMAHINGKELKNDEPFRLKPFMVVVMDGKSLHGDAMKHCRDAMKRIKYGNKIHPVKYKTAENGTEIVKTIKIMATREGAMIKSHEMTADEKGKTKIWKWKKQIDIDARVKDIEKKENETFIYTAEIGNGEERKEIGKTYITAIKAKKEEIIAVQADYITYDEKKDEYTWYAPKVIAVRNEKTEADPISTIKRIAEKKENRSSSKIKYEDIVKKLIASDLKTEIFICGGLAEKMETENDIDILSKYELDEEQKIEIENVLEEYCDRIHFITNAKGPEGNYYHYKKYGATKKEFVIQKHTYGKSMHYDIRFTTRDGKRMWGFTCFKKPTTIAGGTKVLCDEKEYHDLKWMKVDGEIKPGDPGNPTKDKNAKMIIIDKGTYEHIESKDDFKEIILHGEEYKGRYVFRKIKATKKTQTDEVASREKIWVMWKTKDQNGSGKVENIISYQKNEMIVFWTPASAEIE